MSNPHPELVAGQNIALPTEGVFHNLVFVSIRKTYPMQAYKIMHGLWGMGQMRFSKYLVVVDADVDVHNTRDVLFRLCANTDPQRDSVFTKGPADVLDHATSEMAIGTKLGVDATQKLPGEGFRRAWPPLIQMSDDVRREIDSLFGGRRWLASAALTTTTSLRQEADQIVGPAISTLPRPAPVWRARRATRGRSCCSWTP
jgi:4-hydroxy-3-polyprenylbenzoate decarboxylase